MKKILTILLALTMVIGMQSCGSLFKSLVTTTADRYTFPYKNGVGIMEDEQQFVTELEVSGAEGIYLEKAKGKDNYLWVPAAIDISKISNPSTSITETDSPPDNDRIYVLLKDLKVHRIKKH